MISWNDTKAWVTEVKRDKLDCMKSKNFCESKDTIKRVNRQPKEWEKISAKHISNKGLISRIHRELLRLNNKKYF